MTDIDYAYESDFDDGEVVDYNKPKKAEAVKVYDESYSDHSVELASNRSGESGSSEKHSKKSNSPKYSKPSSDASKPYFIANHDSENEYENSFEEESEDNPKPSLEIKDLKNNQIYKTEVPNSDREPGRRSDQNKPPLRPLQQSGSPTYSHTPIRLGGKNDSANERPPRGKGSAGPASKKSSVRLSKNSTLEHIKPKLENPAKKNRQLLEKENKNLREQLKSLNEQLSQYLDAAALELKGKKKNKQEREIRVNTDLVVDKRLKIYEDEYRKVKERYEKIYDSQYIIDLKDDIKKKEKLLSEFEKRNKFLGKDQKNRSKQIENYDDKEMADHKLSYQHLQEEYIKLEEQISLIQEQMSKEKEWYSNNTKKEEELSERLEKLERVKPEEDPVYEVNNGTQKRYNQAKSNLQTLEKTKTGLISQLKVQEYSIKKEKEGFAKELAELQEKIKEKTEELRKVKYELDDTLMLASNHNMGKLVNLLNRPSSERAQSDSNDKSESIKEASTKNDEETGKISPKARSEYDLSTKPKLTSEKQLKSGYTKEPKKEVKPAKDADEIDEDIPEDLEEKPGILKSLEDSIDKTKTKKEEVKKKSIFEELEEEPPKKAEPKTVDVKKKSILEELESDHKKLPEKTKPSIFQELEKPSSKGILKPIEENKKPSFLDDLEDDKSKRVPMFRPPSNDKTNFFAESEKKNDMFAPIKERTDDIFNTKDNAKAESKNLGIFDQLDTKKDDNLWNKIEPKKNFNPLNGEDEKKNDLFSGISVPDPTTKRNRGHLKKDLENKEEKIAAMAANAANNDFFGGFLGEEKGVSNIQSKLLPIRNDSLNKKQESDLFSDIKPENDFFGAKKPENDFFGAKKQENDFFGAKKPENDFFGAKKPENDFFGAKKQENDFFGKNEFAKGSNESKSDLKKPPAKKAFDLDEEDLLL